MEVGIFQYRNNVISKAVLFLLFVSHSNVYANRFSQALKQLKDGSSISISTRGPLCEKLVQKMLIEEFPQQRFRILGNLEYFSNRRVTGELDILVMDKDDSDAVVLVGEVKCKNNEQKARIEARMQMKRFQDYVEAAQSTSFKVQEPCKIHLRGSDRQWMSVPCESFAKTNYRYFHPKNGRKTDSGDLELSIIEIDRLLLEIRAEKGFSKRRMLNNLKPLEF